MVECFTNVADDNCNNLMELQKISHRNKIIKLVSGDENFPKILNSDASGGNKIGYF